VSCGIDERKGKTVETKDRPHAAAIKALKTKIKDLASKQRSLKLLRKTTLPPERRTALLAETGMVKAWEGRDVEGISYSAWSLVETRRTEITAAINLYHELRGSEHRHGVDEQSGYYYEKTLATLRKELAV
jgi:hypothetical protein